MRGHGCSTVVWQDTRATLVCVQSTLGRHNKSWQSWAANSTKKKQKNKEKWWGIVRWHEEHNYYGSTNRAVAASSTSGASYSNLPPVYCDQRNRHGMFAVCFTYPPAEDEIIRHTSGMANYCYFPVFSLFLKRFLSHVIDVDTVPPTLTTATATVILFSCFSSNKSAPAETLLQNYLLLKNPSTLTWTRFTSPPTTAANEAVRYMTCSLMNDFLKKVLEQRCDSQLVNLVLQVWALMAPRDSCDPRRTS